MAEEKRIHICRELSEKEVLNGYATAVAAEIFSKENPDATLADFKADIMYNYISDLSTREIMYCMLGKSDQFQQLANGGLTDEAFDKELWAVQDNPNAAILVSALQDPEGYGIPEDIEKSGTVNSVFVKTVSDHDYNGQTAAEFIAECVQQTRDEIAPLSEEERQAISFTEVYDYIDQVKREFRDANDLQYPFDDIRDMQFLPDETADTFSEKLDAEYIGYISARDTLDDLDDQQVESLLQGLMEQYSDAFAEDFGLPAYTYCDLDDIIGTITEQDCLDYVPDFYPVATEEIAQSLQAETLRKDSREMNPAYNAIAIRGVFEDPNKIVADDGTERYVDCEGGEYVPLAKYLSVCHERAKEAASALSCSYDQETQTVKIAAGELDYIPSNMFTIGGTDVPTSNLMIDNSIRNIGYYGVETYPQTQLQTVSIPDLPTIDLDALSVDTKCLIIGEKEYRTTLPYEIRSGMTFLECYQLEKQFNENKIPYTMENMESAKAVIHAGIQSYNTIRCAASEIPHVGDTVKPVDYFAAACREFARSGCPLEEFRKRLMAKDNPEYRALVQKTADEFVKNYKQAPRIVEDVAYGIWAGYLPEDFVKKERFEVNRMKSVIAKRAPLLSALAVMGAIDDPNLRQALITSPVINRAAQAIRTDLKEGVDRNKTAGYMKFLLNHPNTNRDLLEIAESAYRTSEFEVNEHTTTGDLRYMKSMEHAITDLKEIESKYPDFSLKDLKSSLEGPTIYQDGYKAYFLPANDIRQVVIGRDTHCCQHIHGAGETSMMYGLVNPDAGFFVVERLSDHNIVAQGESWLAEDKKTLCFDNIEFADDKDMRSFAPIVAKFAAECPYENVVTGCGYNAFMNSGEIRTERGIDPPTCEEYRKVMETCRGGTDDDDYVYTDSDNNVGVIKENNVIEPFFAQAYEEKEGHPLVPEKAKEEEREEPTEPEQPKHGLFSGIRSSLASLIGAAEAEKKDEPVNDEQCRDDMEH